MKLKLWLIFGFISAVALSAPLSADFIQCAGETNCDGSENADIINGSPLWDVQQGDLGDDLLFGSGGPDSIYGQEDNDVHMGGLGSDWLDGDEGNDIFLPGPDDGEYSQFAWGQTGNDSFTSFASETSTCLFIEAGGGQDTVNLIGFGPYSAHSPFGQTGWNDGYVLVVDPIAGGIVLIHGDENGDGGAETIHGLPSPNVVILADEGDLEALNCPDLHPDIVE